MRRGKQLKTSAYMIPRARENASSLLTLNTSAAASAARSNNCSRDAFGVATWGNIPNPCKSGNTISWAIAKLKFFFIFIANLNPKRARKNAANPVANRQNQRVRQPPLPIGECEIPDEAGRKIRLNHDERAECNAGLHRDRREITQGKSRK